MYKVGITGSIATGKSTVARYLEKKGYPVIDCDVLAKEALEIDTDAYKAVVTKFDSAILLDDRTVNRKKLGEIIFNNKEQRLALESIVHEQVLRDVQRLLRRYKCQLKEVVFIDIPLLYEVKWNFLVDEIWVVACSKEEQLNRLMKRDCLSREEAMTRVNSQMLISEKTKLADVVIDSNLKIKQMYNQIDKELDRVSKG